MENLCEPEWLLKLMWRLLGNGDITGRVKQGLRQDYGNGEVKGNGKGYAVVIPSIWVHTEA